MTQRRYDLRSSDASRVLLTAGSTCPEIWSLEAGYIRQVTEIPEADFAFGSGICAAGKDIIPGGGLIRTGGVKKTSCALFSLESPTTWSSLPDLSAPRWGHGAASLGSRTFVIGGSLPCLWTDNVEFLNLADEGEGGVGAEEWQVGPSAPEPLYCPKIALLGTHIYALDDHTGKMFCLDAEAGQWTSKAGVAKRLASGTSLAAANGTLYLAGGDSKVCMYYDPLSDSWNSGAAKPSLDHVYGCFVPSSAAGKLILAGGATAAVEEYDITSGTWRDTGCKLPQPTSYGQGVLIYRHWNQTV